MNQYFFKMVLKILATSIDYDFLFQGGIGISLFHLLLEKRKISKVQRFLVDFKNRA